MATTAAQFRRVEPAEERTWRLTVLSIEPSGSGVAEPIGDTWGSLASFRRPRVRFQVEPEQAREILDRYLDGGTNGVTIELRRHQIVSFTLYEGTAR